MANIVSMNNKLLTEIASVKNDITFPTMSEVYRQLDPTLLAKSGGRGIHLYDDLLRDTHTIGVIQKRLLAVVAHKWEVIPSSDKLKARKIADEVTAQLKNLSFTRICMDLLLACVYGYSVGEVLWARSGNKIVAKDVVNRDQFRFFVDDTYAIRLRTTENMWPGETVPDRKFIWHKFGSRSHNPYGRGLGEAVWFWVQYRREITRMWLEYMEKYAAPTVVVTTEDSTAEFQTEAFKLANSIASNSGVQVPAGMTIELLESKRNTSTDVFDLLLERCNQEISKCILGESASSTKSEHTSKATAAEYGDLQMALVRVDSDLLGETLNNTLVKWIVELNFPGEECPTLVREVSSPEDLFKRAQRDQYIATFGFRPTLAQVTQTYGGEWEAFEGNIGLGNNDNNRQVADKAAQPGAGVQEGIAQ